MRKITNAVGFPVSKIDRDHSHHVKFSAAISIISRPFQKIGSNSRNRFFASVFGFVLCLGYAFLAEPASAGTIYATEPASDIGQTTATLNGNAASTIGLSGEIFDYGPTTEYGSSAAATPQGVNGPVSAQVSGLECGTTYHFRFRGDPKPPRTTIQGKDMTFTTLKCPQRYEDVDAGPIYSNRMAQHVCPPACQGANGTWSGQWTTIQGGATSVCGCWISE